MGHHGSDFTPDWHDKKDNPGMKFNGYAQGSVTTPSQAFGELAARAAQMAVRAALKLDPRRGFRAGRKFAVGDPFQGK